MRATTPSLSTNPKSDRRKLLALQEHIETLPHSSPVLPAIMSELCDLLECDQSLAYRPSPTESGWSCDFAFTAGFSPLFEDSFTRFLSATPGRYAWFNPEHPEAPQRNVVLRVSSLMSPAEFYGAPLVQQVLAPLGVAASDQLRVLICDGDLLLTWIGCFRSQPFTAREENLFHDLIRPLQQRLKLERQVRRATLLEQGLLAALHAFSSPAFFARHDGVVELANEPGRRWLQRGGTLGGAATAAGKATVTQVADPGSTPYSIVVIPDAQAEAQSRLLSARQRWALSPRQVDVLEHLVTGSANKTIAERLHCAEVTIEVHVTSLLRKMSVDSRAALIAKFWTFI